MTELMELTPEQIDAIEARARHEYSARHYDRATVLALIATLRQAWNELAASEEMIDAKQEWAVKLLFERDKAEAERDLALDDKYKTVAQAIDESNIVEQELRHLRELLATTTGDAEGHDQLKAAAIAQSHEIEQTLGKALGFPWYKDDQANFPGATEANGVCVGEHTAETLAKMIVKALYEARTERDRAWAELGALKEATHNES